MSAPYFAYYPAPQPPRRWWRINRGWLAVIPIALALALLSSSFAFRTVQSDQQPDELQVAVNGQIDFSTTVGNAPVVISMELTGHEVGPASGGFQAPPGGLVWTVEVTFTSVNPSDVDLVGCSVFLVDTEQRRYARRAGLLGSGPSSYPAFDCSPSRDEGSPWVRTWSFGVADSVRIEGLYLWWDAPRIAVLPLPA